MDSDNLLRINELATIIPRGRPLGSRTKRRRQPHKETTRRNPSGFEYSRALFSRAIADAQRFTEPPTTPPTAPSITAEGVAQQEEQAAINAFFEPLATRERGRGRGRSRGRGIATGDGVSRDQDLSYARGHEGQFEVI